MKFRIFLKMSLGASLLMAVTSAFAGISCKDVQYGSDSYGESMEALARQAKLPDYYFNRYHEVVVSDICDGDNNEDETENLIDGGYIKRSESEAIRKVLGFSRSKSHVPLARSKVGKDYEFAYHKFIKMDLSLAFASNAAGHYSTSPNTKCGQLAKQALAGNKRAIVTLQSEPSYCLKYN